MNMDDALKRCEQNTSKPSNGSSSSAL